MEIKSGSDQEEDLEKAALKARPVWSDEMEISFVESCISETKLEQNCPKPFPSDPSRQVARRNTNHESPGSPWKAIAKQQQWHKLNCVQQHREGNTCVNFMLAFGCGAAVA